MTFLEGAGLSLQVIIKMFGIAIPSLAIGLVIATITFLVLIGLSSEETIKARR